MTLTTRAVLSLVATAVSTETGKVNDATDNLSLTKTYNLTNGTGSSQANVDFQVEVDSIAGATVDSYNVKDGTLNDIFGNDVVMTAVKVFYIENTGDVSLVVGGANGVVGGGFTLLPGEALLRALSGTGHDAVSGPTITVALSDSGGDPGSYKLVIVGIES